MSFPTPMDVDRPPAHKVSYDDSWELHKPQLAKLYLQENRTVPKIRDMMFDEHNFRAECHQYKYRFRKWGWEKRLTSAKKAHILEIGEKRAARGEATAIHRQGRKIESKQLLRYAREAKADIRLFSGSTSIQLPKFMSESLLNQQIGFAGWNMPHQHILRKLARSSNHATSFSPVDTPPSGSDICTPPGQDAMSPGLTRAISIRAANANAERLLLGDFGGLMKCLKEAQLKSLAEWMNQYWYLCYMTAKNWGSHPNTWTSVDLAPFTRLLESSASSPHDIFTNEAASPSSASYTRADIASLVHAAMEQKLCKWTIHVNSIDWHYLPDPPSTDENTDDGHIRLSTYENRMHEAMRSNTFSSISEEDLPVSLKRMSEIVSNSPAQVYQEGVKFAIISRNIELLCEMLEKQNAWKMDLATIHPLHLALTYLDGSRSCCMIFQRLLLDFETFEFDLQSLGPSQLSLFDCLMIHILRNHTTTLPGIAIGDIPGAKAFGGEDVDACGRWDPASDGYRYLLQHGLQIPPSWRHRFCHTSIQLICHCLRSLGTYATFNSGSLFLKRCFQCGLKMTLPPIHVLVLTAWNVLRFGADDEDLFGMICVLLCVSVSDPPGDHSTADTLPFRSVQVDPANFACEPTIEQEICGHESLWPSELARKLTDLVTEQSRPTGKQGWFIFCRILQQIEDQYRWVTLDIVPAAYALTAGGGSNLQNEDERLNFVFYVIPPEPRNVSKVSTMSICEHDLSYKGLGFGQDGLLGHLWAACQADLLHHRRRQSGSAWTSEYLNITIIEAFLDARDPSVLPVIQSGKLNRYCICGNYFGRYNIPRREQVCGRHFGDLDDGNLAAYVDDGMV